MRYRSAVVGLCLVSLLCGPCGAPSHAGPFQKWRARRQGGSASPTDQCGPGGCPPTGGGVAVGAMPPGFQALTPLAGQTQVAVTSQPVAMPQQTYVVAQPADVPIAQAVPAPAPTTVAPDPSPPPLAPERLAAAIAVLEKFATPQPAKQPTPTLADEDDDTARRLQAIEDGQAQIMRELGIEATASAADALLDETIPTVTVRVQTSTLDRSETIDLKSILFQQLGANAQ